MKTKPFDLEKAKAGHKICTRDGSPARIICWDIEGKFPIAAAVVIDGEKTKEEVYTYTNSGTFSDTEAIGTDLMLAIETEEKEGWVNVYDYGRHHRCGAIFCTKEDALSNIEGGAGYIDTIKIKWEEELPTERHPKVLSWND